MFIRCFDCFLNVTANTEIYTYLHTLSLRDALPISNLLVIAAQDRIAAIDDRHLAAEFVEDAGELVGNIAAARDHDPLGQGFEVEDLVRGDRIFAPRKFGNEGPAARGDEDAFGGEFGAVGELHLLRADDRRAGLEDLDLVVVERLAIEALEPVDLAEHIVAQHIPVEPAVGHVPAELARILQILDRKSTRLNSSTQCASSMPYSACT